MNSYNKYSSLLINKQGRMLKFMSKFSNILLFFCLFRSLAFVIFPLFFLCLFLFSIVTYVSHFLDSTDCSCCLTLPFFVNFLSSLIQWPLLEVLSQHNYLCESVDTAVCLRGLISEIYSSLRSTAAMTMAMRIP